MQDRRLGAHALAVLAVLLGSPASAWQQVELLPAGDDGAGIPAAALEGLADCVQAFVDEGRVVGAELLVVKDRRTVLHRGFGLRDREQGLPMEPDTVFNLRSMTKPVVGTAALLLLDDGVLDRDAPVASYLPEFEEGLSARITVEHLLTHRSGLGWNVCMDGSSLREMAACCARVGPREFLPGTSFQYSNSGSNVLGAVLEVAGEKDLELLLEQRVLAPLGMEDTFSIHRGEDPRLARCACRYVIDEAGAWQRSWGPADGAPMDFLQGAQGLAGTTRDYARFLALWLDEGRIGTTQLLSPEAVWRGLEPVSLADLPTGFPGRRTYYARHWRLWTRGSAGEVEAFGHSGSDGTFAWAWPDRDLMILYFTQAVNTSTGIELEEEIDRWLLASEEPTVPEPLRRFVGHYWHEPGQMVRSIWVDAEGELNLDVPGTASFQLAATEDPLHFEVVGRSGFDCRFEEDASGAITALVPPAVTGEDPAPRLAVDPGLPSVDALMALRFNGEETGSPGSLGVFRMLGSFEHSSGQGGTDELLSDGELRSREDVVFSEKRREATICNGGRACTVSRLGRRRELTGAHREALLLNRMAVVAGDWRRFHERVEVVARGSFEDRDVYLVRTAGKQTPPSTWIVDAESGLPVLVHDTVRLPFGAMGKTTRFEDWREIEGVHLPFRWVSRFAEESMGATTVQYEEIETHLEPEGNPFAIDAPAGR